MVIIPHLDVRGGLKKKLRESPPVGNSFLWCVSGRIVARGKKTLHIISTCNVFAVGKKNSSLGIVTLSAARSLVDLDRSARSLADLDRSAQYCRLQTAWQPSQSTVCSLQSAGRSMQTCRLQTDVVSSSLQSASLQA